MTRLELYINCIHIHLTIYPQHFSVLLLSIIIIVLNNSPSVKEAGRDFINCSFLIGVVMGWQAKGAEGSLGGQWGEEECGDSLRVVPSISLALLVHLHSSFKFAPSGEREWTLLPCGRHHVKHVLPSNPTSQGSFSCHTGGPSKSEERKEASLPKARWPQDTRACALPTMAKPLLALQVAM